MQIRQIRTFKGPMSQIERYIRCTVKCALVKMQLFGLIVVVIASGLKAEDEPVLVGSTQDVTSRVIKGKPASIGQFPWQAGLYIVKENGSYFCGGALIAPQWILTAAHCTFGGKQIYVRLGGITLDPVEAGRLDLTSTDHFEHESFNPENLRNDIGLVKLQQPAAYSQRVRAIDLPPRGIRIGPKSTLVASGWGKLDDAEESITTRLHYGQLISIPNRECEKFFGSAVTDAKMCCRGNPDQNTCQGDSGGPLVANLNEKMVHVGIASFVDRKGCSNHPSGYTRTGNYLNWISKKTGIEISE